MTLVLLNIKRKFEVAIIDETTDKITIKNPTLKDIMQIDGIDIPAFLQKAYEGKTNIKLGEKNFTKAFREVYCEFNLNRREETHKWYKKIR